MRIPVAARHTAWFCGRSLFGITGSNPWGGGHGCLSVVSVVCCQVEVSATGWSFIQRSPTECDVSECDQMQQKPITPAMSSLKEVRLRKKEKKKEKRQLYVMRNWRGQIWVTNSLRGVWRRVSECTGGQHRPDDELGDASFEQRLGKPPPRRAALLSWENPP